MCACRASSEVAGVSQRINGHTIDVREQEESASAGILAKGSVRHPRRRSSLKSAARPRTGVGKAHFATGASGKFEFQADGTWLAIVIESYIT